MRRGLIVDADLRAAVRVPLGDDEGTKAAQAARRCCIMCWKTHGVLVRDDEFHLVFSCPAAMPHNRREEWLGRLEVRLHSPYTPIYQLWDLLGTSFERRRVPMLASFLTALMTGRSRARSQILLACDTGDDSGSLPSAAASSDGDPHEFGESDAGSSSSDSVGSLCRLPLPVRCVRAS